MAANSQSSAQPFGLNFFPSVDRSTSPGRATRSRRHTQALSGLQVAKNGPRTVTAGGDFLFVAQDMATAAERANIHPMTRATAPIHTCTLHPGPVAGVHAVQMHSARAFGKHWHDSFGFGLMDQGGQVSASGRGQVLALAGQIITTNPKPTLFFLAVLSQFMDATSRQPMLEFGVLSGVFMAMTFGVFVVYGLLTHTFRQSVVKSPAIQAGLRRGFAAAFAVMAGKLAWSAH